MKATEKAFQQINCISYLRSFASLRLLLFLEHLVRGLRLALSFFINQRQQPNEKQDLVNLVINDCTRQNNGKCSEWRGSRADDQNSTRANKSRTTNFGASRSLCHRVLARFLWARATPSCPPSPSSRPLAASSRRLEKLHPNSLTSSDA